MCLARARCCMIKYACKEWNAISTFNFMSLLTSCRHKPSSHKHTTHWQDNHKMTTITTMPHARELQLRTTTRPTNIATKLRAVSLSHGQISTDSPATFTAEVGKRSAQARAHVREGTETKWKRIAHSNRWDPDIRWMQNPAVTPSLFLTEARRLHSRFALCWPPTVLGSILCQLLRNYKHIFALLRHIADNCKSTTPIPHHFIFPSS